MNGHGALVECVLGEEQFQSQNHMVHLRYHEVAARQLVAARETCYQRCHWINIAVAGRTSGASCSIDWSVRTLPSNVTTLNEWFWLPGVLERIAGMGALQLLVSCAPAMWCTGTIPLPF